MVWTRYGLSILARCQPQSVDVSTIRCNHCRYSSIIARLGCLRTSQQTAYSFGGAAGKRVRNVDERGFASVEETFSSGGKEEAEVMRAGVRLS